jgi:arylsulfatase A-like enzyme
MHPSAIILIIDRLGAGYLGPYGNTWLETSAFNRLASRSLLCEQVLASSPDLAGAYRDYWLGTNDSPLGSLLQLAKTAGYHSVLVTDEADLKTMPGVEHFDELHYFNAAKDQPTEPAEELSLTSLSALLDLTHSQLATWKDSSQPQLLWIHASALNSIWDAPLELRAQFGDEDDPEPSAAVTPPEMRLDKNHDPDELLRLAHAFAGQVAMIDWGLERLLAAIDDLPQRDDLLIALTSPRGYPLGEHGRVGRCDDALYSELLHVPLLVQFPQQEGALLRTQELIQPDILFATLRDALRLGGNDATPNESLVRLVRSEPFAHRHLAIATAANQRVLRTAAWQLRETIAEEGPRYELFTKPDDRWEFNDIASRAAEIVELLLKQANESENAIMPEVLTSPWR